DRLERATATAVDVAEDVRLRAVVPSSHDAREARGGSRDREPELTGRLYEVRAARGRERDSVVRRVLVLERIDALEEPPFPRVHERKTEREPTIALFEVSRHNVVGHRRARLAFVVDDGFDVHLVALDRLGQDAADALVPPALKTIAELLGASGLPDPPCD